MGLSQFEQALHGFSAVLKIVFLSLYFLFLEHEFLCQTFPNFIKHLAASHQPKHARFGNKAAVMSVSLFSFGILPEHVLLLLVLYI